MVGCDSPSPLSSESSSPMANAPPSSGTFVNTGLLGLRGLRTLSIELFRKGRPGLFGGSDPCARSFLRCLRRSISSLPLSSVNDRRASKRFFDLMMARINIGFSMNTVGILSTYIQKTKKILLTFILMLNNCIHRFQQRLEQQIVGCICKQKAWRRHKQE